MVDRLFGRFALLYGNAFADVWRGLPADEVKKCWGDELSIYTIEQVGIAVDKLKSEGGKFPPSLPDFLRLCNWARQVRPDEGVTEFARLPARLAEGKQTPEWQEAKARCMAEVAKFGKTPPSRDWAHKIIQRRDAGEIIPPAVLAKALAAVGNSQGI